ncbi:excisionase family DNA binding protein [Arthrobacter pascens]|uniref:helix-turn-helix domain-containing protein n=1 Tax=Arthrobacter pascens TaxID=1677 RepID=UPI00278D036D|nr:helix-turn-helix domain-containing protein [Arthrobacter pascens]MDQ0679107.1 excisionase family DNA binding protein [Arthrobacter pascens]
MDDSPLLTAADLAAELHVNVETVYKMCKSGKWPHSRIGRLYRFTEDHYQAIIGPTAAPDRRRRTQRENIARLLRSTSQDSL